MSKKNFFTFSFFIIAATIIYLIIETNQRLEREAKEAESSILKTATASKEKDPLKKEGIEVIKKEFDKNNVALNQAELDLYIQKELSEFFDDIIYEFKGKCPDRFNLREGSASISCVKEIELTPVVSLIASQKFINTRISQYEFILDGVAEPLGIEFETPERIKELNLYYDGAAVFSVKFKNNLVIETIVDDADYKKMFRLQFYDKEYLNLLLKEKKHRFDVLKLGKSKMELFLENLCLKSKHEKTCGAHKKLVEFHYPVPKID